MSQCQCSTQRFPGSHQQALALTSWAFVAAQYQPCIRDGVSLRQRGCWWYRYASLAARVFEQLGEGIVHLLRHEDLRRISEDDVVVEMLLDQARTGGAAPVPSIQAETANVSALNVRRFHDSAAPAQDRGVSLHVVLVSRSRGEHLPVRVCFAVLRFRTSKLRVVVQTARAWGSFDGAGCWRCRCLEPLHRECWHRCWAWAVELMRRRYRRRR